MDENQSLVIAVWSVARNFRGFGIRDFISANANISREYNSVYLSILTRLYEGVEYILFEIDKIMRGMLWLATQLHHDNSIHETILPLTRMNELIVGQRKRYRKLWRQ